jgi:hypothetical protein
MPVNNPLTVPVMVTTIPTVIYIMPITFASWTQKVTVTPPGDNPTPWEAQGSGEGNQLAMWSYPVNTGTPPQVFNFQVHIQHWNGNAWVDNPFCGTTNSSSLTAHVNWVFSEDSTDNDLNDCFVEFVWFNYWEFPKQFYEEIERTRGG